MAPPVDRCTRRHDGAQAMTTFDPRVDQELLAVFERATRPDDCSEILQLFIGRVESRLGAVSRRPELARRWLDSRHVRDVAAEELLHSPATVRFVKRLFNFYFKDDLYGDLRSASTVILSSGSLDEHEWGLPATLKECLTSAVDRDWYGYSDSRGRETAREAVAAYEAVRLTDGAYGVANVALTLGATSAISTIADMVLGRKGRTCAPSLCVTPNYPPLVSAVERRGNVQLVPLASRGGHVDVEPLLAALRPDTPLVLLQTVGNPTGELVAESDLTRLIQTASPSTMIVLDECHEWLGPVHPISGRRTQPNVIRVQSMSKGWSAPGLKVGWILADEAVIDDFYECASTSYGGPPSVFYLMVEVLARMERWRLSSVTFIRNEHKREFESAYGFSIGSLQASYQAYCADRARREAGLLKMRSQTVQSLDRADFHVLSPQYSINVAADSQVDPDSYTSFRRLLYETGVSVFPGILTYCLRGGIVRVTAARQPTELAEGMKLLAGRLRGREAPPR